MTITRCEFSTQPTDVGYQYTTQFFSGEKLHSEKTFDFHSALETTPACPCRFVDIYSQNGSCAKKSNFLSALFKDSISELETALARHKMLSSRELIQTLVTLDLKDSKLSYRDKPVIRQAEDRFCNFLCGDCDSDTESLLPVRGPEDFYPESVKKQAHTLFKQMDIQYVLREGSLKADLLDHLTQPQQQFFLSPGTDFCEFTEIIMTACKQGDSINGLPPLTNYVVPIGKEPFTPRTPHEIWYPKFYEGLYNPKSRITEIQRNIFDVLATKQGDIVVTEIRSPTRRIYALQNSPYAVSSITTFPGPSSAESTPVGQQ